MTRLLKAGFLLIQFFFSFACSILSRRAFKEKKRNSKCKIQNSKLNPSVLRTPPLNKGRSKKPALQNLREKGGAAAEG